MATRVCAHWILDLNYFNMDVYLMAFFKKSSDLQDDLSEYIRKKIMILLYLLAI
jgi:hypothetical protein